MEYAFGGGGGEFVGEGGGEVACLEEDCGEGGREVGLEGEV